MHLLPEKDRDENLIENNHFLLQQLNIPNKDDGKTSFRRLMQIALNIGQLRPHKREFTDTIVKLIEKNKMDDIGTYMTVDNYTKYGFTDKDLEELRKILKDLEEHPLLVEIKKGGHIDDKYKRKYHKYKIKYMESKNMI